LGQSPPVALAKDHRGPLTCTEPLQGSVQTRLEPRVLEGNHASEQGEAATLTRSDPPRPVAAQLVQVPGRVSHAGKTLPGLPPVGERLSGGLGAHIGSVRRAQGSPDPRFDLPEEGVEPGFGGCHGRPIDMHTVIEHPGPPSYDTDPVQLTYSRGWEPNPPTPGSAALRRRYLPPLLRRGGLILKAVPFPAPSSRGTNPQSGAFPRSFVAGDQSSERCLPRSFVAEDQSSERCLPRSFLAEDQSSERCLPRSFLAED